MGRIMAVDYGTKRTGLAVTDPLQIIATALDTVESNTLITYLKRYFQKEPVEELVVGMPRQMNNTDSTTAPAVRQFIETFKKNFPAIPVHTADERFTTSLAHHAMLQGGMKKKKRQVKGTADKISAVLILQQFLDMRK
jgi:putative holliday junction resolvase